MQILIIDPTTAHDDARIAVLEAEGFEVMKVDSVEQGRLVLGSRQLRLVILDLPPAACIELREAFEEVPMLRHTHYGDPATRVLLKLLDMAHLKKDCPPQDLVMKVHELLGL